jgi:sugar transferase (PEP-CTERM system associated)
MRAPNRRIAALVFGETVLIVAAVGVAAYIRLGSWMWEIVANEHGVLKTLLVAGVVQGCFYYADLYDLRVTADSRELFTRVLQALAAASFMLAVLYFWFPDLIIGRGVFLIASALVIAVVFGWRMAFVWLSRHVRPRERLLLVGTNPGALALAREIFEHRRELGVQIVGFIDPDPAKVGQPLINPGVIGTIEDIPSIVRARGVDRVVVSLVDARGKLPMDKLLEMKLERGVTFDHLASVYEDYTGKIAVENLRPSWLIFSEGFRRSRWLAAAKRATDVVLASAGLVLTLPVMGIVAALVKLTSPGPAMYRQQRVGRHGRLFTIQKFRSMRRDAEATTGPVWAAPDDARVTPVGRFIRKARLDELPQLWNVLKGDMSLVGPRPERPEFVAHLTEQIPFYGLRHGVRPGITGWAQVKYTYGASVEDALEKLQYDLFYIKHATMAFDLLVLILSLKIVLLRRGAQ